MGVGWGGGGLTIAMNRIATGLPLQIAGEAAEKHQKGINWQLLTYIKVIKKKHRCRYTPLKTNMTLEITIFNRNYIFVHGGFSIVMLVFAGVFATSCNPADAWTNSIRTEIDQRTTLQGTGKVFFMSYHLLFLWGMIDLCRWRSIYLS